MTPTFQLDPQIEAQFRDQIRDLHSVANRSWDDIVESQGRLVVYDCIKTTPPNSSAPIQENFNVQKKAGEQAISNDVDRLFEPLDKIKAITDPMSKKNGAKVRRLAREGDWKGLSESLFEMGITKNKKTILPTADWDMQRQRRGSRGRISSRFSDAFLVSDTSSIGAIKRKLLPRVGWAKAGWMAAVKALGVKGIPGWVSHHNAPGDFRKGTDKESPSLEFSNNVGYIERLNQNAGILERALKNRIRAMEISTEKAIEHFCDKFNRA